MTSYHKNEDFKSRVGNTGSNNSVNESLTYTELLQRRRNGPGDVPISGDRLLRLPEVLRLYPVGRSTWYAGIKEEKYPEPVRLSARVVAWKESDC